MKMVVDCRFEVNIKSDRVNANEIFDEVGKAGREVVGKLALAIMREYQDQVVEVLCGPSGRVAKKGLGGHEVKGEAGRGCACRRFRRAGYWKETRGLRGEWCAVEFRPRVVKCEGCGKRLTPVLEALELDRDEWRTEGVLRKTMEAVAETSYRRGSAQLDRLAEVPVAKSTAHRWAAKVEWPVSRGSGKPFLGADGTGFKKQPGQGGDVRLVLEMGEKGDIRPLGVWAGTGWEQLSQEVKRGLKKRPWLLVSDGERGLENWMGRVVKRTVRSHWHFARDSGFALWRDGATLGERQTVQGRLGQMLAIEIPDQDLESVSAEDRQTIRDRLRVAEKELDQLREEFQKKGYQKAATYLAHARDRLFNHLRLWLETGIIAPRTASIVENIIRELVRRLKKVGWNWSDAGATRMGRVVMMRRYDPEGWQDFWMKRMNLQGRCAITLTRFEAKRAA